ncbi:MAG: FtsW/RodA/SpoVE family cell cycle protein, partial [Gemmatimonadetes bacterium]|nr:FtsW/RodA/SpoVE family cell cycle protein [Gemmatimonadota bacterium]NIY43153.1 FtsW/RodA/SpoVE family cell cycle protein [Gemmatimonadota bacterium]
VTAFLGGRADPLGAGYQLEQSLIAVGSGGLFGVGYGESVQKYYFLPEPHNDFVFAIIAEEWGWLGVLAVGLSIALIGVLGLRIARRAPDDFGYLLAIGLTALLVVSALIHMGVSVGLLPTTGVTLPFVSYGGSSLVVSLAAVGILLNVGS